MATNLGLLQANMTQKNEQQGPQYHWKVEILKQLPVYDSVEASLKKLNRKRKKALDHCKTEKGIGKRIELKSSRTREAQDRKLWSKKHGQGTYGAEEDAEEFKDTKEGKTRPLTRKCKACGSTTHLRPNHKHCPHNKNKKTAADQSNKKTDDESGQRNSAKISMNITTERSEDIVHPPLAGDSSCGDLSTVRH